MSKKKELGRAKRKVAVSNGLDNAYRLVVLASMRAKEIYAGGKPLLETTSTKPCLIALEEIKSGKIRYKDIK